jgi:hypothetical protein
MNKKEHRLLKKMCPRTPACLPVPVEDQVPIILQLELIQVPAASSAVRLRRPRGVVATVVEDQIPIPLEVEAEWAQVNGLLSFNSSS